MFRWLLNLVGTDNKPDAYISGIDYQEFSAFLGIALAVAILLLIIVWVIMYNKVNKLRDKNEDLKKEVEKYKNSKS